MLKGKTQNQRILCGNININDVVTKLRLRKIKVTCCNQVYFCSFMFSIDAKVIMKGLDDE